MASTQVFERFLAASAKLDVGAMMTVTNEAEAREQTNKIKHCKTQYTNNTTNQHNITIQHKTNTITNNNNKTTQTNRPTTRATPA